MSQIVINQVYRDLQDLLATHSHKLSKVNLNGFQECHSMLEFIEKISDRLREEVVL